MKFIKSLLFILATYASLAQGVVPMKDFNNFFVSFQDGFFQTIELQPVIEYKAGDELVAYVDTRGNLRLYDGKSRKDVTNLTTEFQVSDHLMAYYISGSLRAYDSGKFLRLTNFARGFAVRDSIIVFEDTQYKSLNVNYKGVSTQLTTFSELDFLKMPTSIGENIVIYRDNALNTFAFWRGNTYEIGNFNEEIINYNIGTDVFCFNDPYNQSFVVFQNGKFTDVENLKVNKYKSGRGFIVYEDINGNLIYFSNGEKIQLSNFSASFWDVRDDLVVWSENSYVFAYSNGKKIQIANFIPETYLIKNNIYAFKNIYGGVSALVNGKVEELTNNVDSEFEIFGNKVLVKLFNKTNLVFSEGKKYSN
jgi:hypothetical protein